MPARRRALDRPRPARGRAPLDINALLLLRLAFLAVLYLFLALVARAAWREVRSPPSPPADAPVREIVVLDPARSRRGKGERIAVHPGASVGRETGNAVIVDEDTISARHAVFGAENGHWWLEDLDSTNGTFVNRQRIHGRAPLRDGDQIQFGHVAVRFGPAGKS